jgi:hypothetical protein
MGVKLQASQASWTEEKRCRKGSMKKQQGITRYKITLNKTIIACTRIINPKRAHVVRLALGD